MTSQTPDLVAQAMFNGQRIVELVSLTEAGEPVQVKRQLGRSGWHVMQWVTPQVPMARALLLNGALMMHPVTARRFRAYLKEMHTRG